MFCSLHFCCNLKDEGICALLEGDLPDEGAVLPEGEREDDDNPLYLLKPCPAGSKNSEADNTQKGDGGTMLLLHHC